MLFSNKDIFKIITPILVEMLLSIAIGMVDSVMVSSVGESAVSGVSLVNTINVLLLNFLTAMTVGGAIVMAQLIGRKDNDLAKEAGKQTLYLALFVALVVTTVCFIFRNAILNLIFGKVDADVMYHAQNYFFYTIISTPVLAIACASAGICRAQGETKRPMFFTIIANLVNVVGNAVLIYGYNMGASGAAIATSISRLVHAGLLFVFVLKPKSYMFGLEKVFKYKPNGYLIKRICGIGIPNGFESSMFQIGRVLLTSLVSGFGTASIAANAVANTLTSFQYAQGNAIGAGVTTIVGRCIGAGEKEQAKNNAKKLVFFAYIGMFIVSAILCGFAGPFVSAFNLSSDSTEICKNIIYIHSIMVCLIWPIAFVLPNAFRSANDVKFTTVISMIAMWAFRVALSYVFAYAFNMGVYSVWFAMFLDWVFRIIFFIPRFITGKWLSKYNFSEKIENANKEVA